MTWTLSQKTTFTNFNNTTVEAQILATMQTAYDGSSTAKAMFDNWINANPGNTIDINFMSGKFQAYLNTGKVEIDLVELNNNTYIMARQEPTIYLLGVIVESPSFQASPIQKSRISQP